jgi:hypothetical protein
VTHTLAVLGALGGLAAFLAGVVAVLRGIFRQISATQDNTEAVDRLSSQLGKLSDQVLDHSQRIARLEGRGRR